jgi:peptide/nickel transport system ATP-binding protein
MLASYQEVKVMDAILRVEKLSKVFESGFIRRSLVKAVDNVSFELSEGEIVSLVGQSGSGKTTLAKIILRLLEPSSGDVWFMDENVWKDLKTLDDLKWYWKNVHAIFQNPYASFNPFYKVDRVLNQALKLIGKEPNSEEAKRVIEESLKFVGLGPDEVLGKYPHQLSGGQLQRILIARAWIIKPKLLLADEPVSMLDVSTRGKIIELFDIMRKKYGTTILFVSHDLGISYVISDRIFVMYQGKIIEEGSPDDILLNPTHEYTKELITSVPTLYRKWSF